MIELYSDHELEGDRELIKIKQRETFAGLLPEPITSLKSRIEGSEVSSTPAMRLEGEVPDTPVLQLEYKENAKTTAA